MNSLACLFIQVLFLSLNLFPDNIFLQYSYCKIFVFFFQCDVFEIEAVTLEKIKKIEIGHDGKGIGAGWYLEKVVIKHPDKPKYNVNIDCSS